MSPINLKRMGAQLRSTDRYQVKTREREKENGEGTESFRVVLALSDAARSPLKSSLTTVVGLLVSAFCSRCLIREKARSRASTAEREKDILDDHQYKCFFRDRFVLYSCSQQRRLNPAKI